MNYLFIGGCPRTGTTAMAEILSYDDRIIIGVESFKAGDKILPSDFADDSIFKPCVHRTISGRKKLLKSVEEKRKACKTLYTGNKYPAYTSNLLYLHKTFPGCKIIILLRDLYGVASSFNVRASRAEDHWPQENDYRLAVKRWNEALIDTKRYSDKFGGENLFIASYEKFFSGDMDYLTALYRFLELDLPLSVIDGFKYVSSGWGERQANPLQLDDEMRSYLDKNKDRAIEDWVVKRINDQQNRLLGRRE